MIPGHDLWGRALLDYHRRIRKEPLILHTSFGAPEEVPLEVFFREPHEFSDLELFALDQCREPVLDIGAGAGCHALFLQQHKVKVTALERSPGACKVMRMRGATQVIQGSIHEFTAKHFHTALMMMNGLGLAGSLDGLAPMLDHIISRLSPQGQILADSCDVAYLYRDGKLPPANFYGEQQYNYEYQGQKDPSFPWLFVDIDRLKKEAAKVDLQVQVVFEEHDQYLARITRS